MGEQQGDGRPPRAKAFGAVGPVTILLAGLAGVLALVLLLRTDPAATPYPGADESRVLWAVAGGWLCAVGVLLAVTDLRTHRLPDRLLLGASAVLVPALVAAALLGGSPGALLTSLAGALVPAGVLYALALVMPGGVGLGDVKLLLVTGAWLGHLSVGAATVGPVLGLVLGGVASILAVLARRATMRSHLPLGPALLAGTALATWLDLAGAVSG